ncbi:hypothetical protein MBM_03688 [Drepanopeziza brunnea f. sp. 'multigermtubi' MB_m1]|uniref:Uncharacterized protein n=1 Tax=Marssonina brunnea f. sp. multigermtubi (strain MB_m1) TaxID=1072389 RepID=K1WY13_MARBU|nr:uncharacterized protein MBM_03688 [Drepanopeziza brunnea f. sp. 'multigermtubi' MB_m1]EKD17916.1 hypothetical protein MBM_03688 [Drepanopeziza brunnea f. sp. 'multigermtubi' MB_m1]
MHSSGLSGSIRNRNLRDSTCDGGQCGKQQCGSGGGSSSSNAAIIMDKIDSDSGSGIDYYLGSVDRNAKLGVVRSEYVTARAGKILLKPTISRATYVRAEETGEAIAEFPAEDSTQGFLDRFGFFGGVPSTTSDSDTAHGETRQRQARERTESKLAQYSAKLESYEKAKQSRTAEKESSKASKSAARKTAYEEAKQSQIVEQERRKVSKIKTSDSETILSEKDKSKLAKYSAKIESYDKAKQSQTAERESSKASKYSARKTAYEAAKQSQVAKQEEREASKAEISQTPAEKDRVKLSKYAAKITAYERAKKIQTAERESSKASKSAARKTAHEEAKQSQQVEQEKRKASAEQEKKEASKAKHSDSETTPLFEKHKSKMAKYSAKIESYERAKQSQTAERESSKASKSAARKTAYEEAKQSQVAKHEEREAFVQTTPAEKERVKLSKYAAKIMAYEMAKQSHAAQQKEKGASRIKNAKTILVEKERLKASRDSASKTAREKARQSQVLEQEEREASKIKKGGTTLAEKDRMKVSKYAAKMMAYEEARQSQAAERENRKASRIKDWEAAQAEKEKVKRLRMEPGEEILETSTSSATSSSRSHKNKESPTLTSKAQPTGLLGWGSSVAQKALDRITLKKDDGWRTEAEGDERGAGTRAATQATSGKLTGIPEIKPSSSSPAPRSRTPVELPPKSPGKSGSEPSTSTADAPENETEERSRPVESAEAKTRWRETLQGWAGYWKRARREHDPIDTPSIKKYASSSLADSEESSFSKGGKITKEDKTSVDGKKDTEPKPSASGQAEDESEIGTQKPGRENNPRQPSESSDPSSLWSQVKSAPSDFMAWWAEALRLPDETKDEVNRQKQAAETTGERILKEASSKTEEGVPSSEKQSPETPRTSLGSSKTVWKHLSSWGRSSRQGAAYNEDSLAGESNFPAQEETSFGSTAHAHSRGQDESTDAVSEHPKQEESSKHDLASEDRETDWASPSSQYEAADAGTSETHTTKQKQAAIEAADKELFESLSPSSWGSQMMPAWLTRYLPTSATRPPSSSASSRLKAGPSKARRWQPGSFSFPGERAPTSQEQRVATALDLTLSLYSVIDQLMAEGDSHHLNVTRLQKAWDRVSSSSKVLDSSQLINKMARESDGRDRLQTYPGVVHRFSDLARSLAGVSIQIVNGEITEEMASRWLNESTKDSIEAFVQQIKKRPHFAFDEELVSEGFHWQILTDCKEILRLSRDALSKNYASVEI